MEQRDFWPSENIKGEPGHCMLLPCTNLITSNSISVTVTLARVGQGGFGLQEIWPHQSSRLYTGAWGMVWWEGVLYNAAST